MSNLYQERHYTMLIGVGMQDDVFEVLSQTRRYQSEWTGRGSLSRILLKCG